MATTPTTLVIITEDKIHFPVKHALLVIKQLFQYGVGKMYTKGNKVFISLSYSPLAQTLKKKFGNLPIRYMRTKLENQEDFKVLENIIKRYRFNLLDEEVEDLDRRRLDAPPGKRYLEAPSLQEFEEIIVEDNDYVKPQETSSLPEGETSLSSDQFGFDM